MKNIIMLIMCLPLAGVVIMAGIVTKNERK